jgi:adenylate cyclase class 2
MVKTDQELEVKFYLSQPDRLLEKIERLKGDLISPRVFELNLRFDLPTRELTKNFQVLRLRKDNASHLTYKGPAQDRVDVSARQEIEFEVSDFDSARAFLEALGYEAYISYEKYRATYSLDNVLIVIDEMPYGWFVEIEGPDAESIKSVAEKLQLKWETRITVSYMALFQKVKDNLKSEFSDLTFEKFDGVKVSAKDLDIIPAD